MSTYRLKNLLAPRSVALVGASPRHGSVGRAILNNIRKAQFKGSSVSSIRAMPRSTVSRPSAASQNCLLRPNLLSSPHRHGLFPDLSTRQARASDIIVVG